MLTLLLISSLFCLGVHNAFKQGGILFFIRKATEYFTPVMIRKPLYDCLPCMASVWGGTSIIIQLFYPYPIALVLIYIGAISGLNLIINLLIEHFGYEQF